MKAVSLFRIRLISFIIFLFTFVLFYKLYTLQIVHGTDYTDKANHQYAPTAALFDRGSIFFQTKDGDLVSAATLQNGFTVAIKPKNILDPQLAFEKINGVVPIDKDLFLAKAMKKDDPYEEILKKLLPDKALQIDAFHLPGVSLYKDKWRYYPGNSLAAQVLGFVGSNGSDVSGRYGLEKYYEDTLNRNDQNLNQNFFAEIFSDLKTTVVDNSKQEGDIVTTIEPTVEAYLEKELTAIKAEWNPSVVGGIVINPANGEIYGMAANPTFDPNTYNQEKDSSVFTNQLVESRYEMGSIIKPLTMAAGLDSGTVTLESTYNDTGCIELNSKRICNFDGKARGVIPMQQILSQSLNVGASFVALKMGSKTFSSYMRAYGLGDETGIDLPGEIHGDVANLDSTRDVEQATASFGQGIAMTPIETVRALSYDGDGRLSEAVAAAAKRSSGESFVWDQRNATADITPLVAVTWALHAVLNTKLIDPATHVW